MSVPNPFPWYDSLWLSKYVYARKIVERCRPGALADFVAAFDPLRTRLDFQPILLERVFEDAVMGQVVEMIEGLRGSELELHEARSFGRFVVHDHPFITALQRQIVDLVSTAVGEAIEPSYNFLSLYTRAGTCAPHLDAPSAKWTLDLCVRQSRPWPIHFSQVVPWLEYAPLGPDWSNELREHSNLRFSSYSMEPGNALVFGGSGQWHFRDAMPDASVADFCDLIFFHFIPSGCAELLRPRNWARLFDLPELAGLQDENPRRTSNSRE